MITIYTYGEIQGDLSGYYSRYKGLSKEQLKELARADADRIIAEVEQEEENHVRP